MQLGTAALAESAELAKMVAIGSLEFAVRDGFVAQFGCR
jgi:hypothetical protein